MNPACRSISAKVGFVSDPTGRPGAESMVASSLRFHAQDSFEADLPLCQPVLSASFWLPACAHVYEQSRRSDVVGHLLGQAVFSASSGGLASFNYQAKGYLRKW